MNDALPVNRRRWMAVLAVGPVGQIRALLGAVPALPVHTRLRGPEAGLVMVRGRAGGDGAPFNLGEASVTRCTVRLDDGTIGHAYVSGRDGAHAELAAALDAALQTPERANELAEAVIVPLARAQAARLAETARKAAATRVEFFTLATMRT